MGLLNTFAAATAPPNLKAIFPVKAMFDFYDFAHPGGIYREDVGIKWSQLTRSLDNTIPTVPVDGDPDGRLLAEARAEHRENRYAHTLFRDLPYRDSVHQDTDSMLHITRSPATRLSDISRSGIPVYQLAGWYDVFVKDALLWFAQSGNTSEDHYRAMVAHRSAQVEMSLPSNCDGLTSG